jgi:hypothetical protein
MQVNHAAGDEHLVSVASNAVKHFFVATVAFAVGI